MNEFDVNKNTITINETTVVFEYDIAEVIKIKELLIIRLSIPQSNSVKLEDFNNVYCIENDGKVKWQINNLKIKSSPIFKIAPIVLLNNSDNGLYATDFMGRRYEINIETGEMSFLGISK